ncbi:CRISPR-associated endonuclease Cas1 [bacterium]|nr:MAG: CRISPR-associated endonuclease Cas1 [bacterium]
MPNLYVITQGAKLKLKGSSVIIEKDDEIIQELELIHIDNIIVYGNIQFSTQLVKRLVRYGKSLTLLYYNGSLAGRFVPAYSKDVQSRIMQIEMHNDQCKKLYFARKIVHQKIENCIGLTQRYETYHPDRNLNDYQNELQEYSNRVQKCDNENELLGLEGSAARVYFSAFDSMLVDEWKFTGRTKHPPQDPINSILSFGYTILANEIGALAEASGLDPFVGFYHTTEYGRQSLAQDILEIFRAPIVDRVALRLFNLNRLQESHFMETEKGIRFRRDAIQIFIREYEKVLQSEVEDELTSQKVSYRRILQLQIERLKNYIKNEKELWLFDYRKY